MTSKGLGKGLGALLGEGAAMPGEGAVMLRLSEIEPNESQPRKSFEPEPLSELADSIKTHGVISPLLVRRQPSGTYQIIAGERRWRAARMAGVTLLPAIVHEADDRQATELALIENLQREGLNPVEIAQGYRTLMEEYGLTQEEVSSQVGRSRSAVANTVRLLSLPQGVLQMLHEGKLSEGHVRPLLSLPEKRREGAARRMEEQAMSVRQAEVYAKKLAEQLDKDTEEPKTPVNYLAGHEKQLSEKWGRKVSISAGRRKGKVELEFYDADDLEALVERLLAE
ncbi:MAG: ParB/RepB/Spo0J family partition protein [Oscillospiraceae bacterium]|nr:ParB/RepB/Spo0J family partition protein [Oscillospiraceae bacterium]